MNESGMLTHVAVIDREPVLRVAFEKLLRSFTSCWVAGSYESFDDFFLRSNGYPFDAFLLRITDLWPIDWCDLRNIRMHKPDAGVVVVLPNAAIRFAPGAIQNGARAVVSTAAEPQELQEAIVAAACNKSFLCRMAASAIQASREEEEKARGLDELSSRECDVLSLTGRGLRLKEIAEQLGVNVKSAHSYRVRAMQKLGLQNTAQIVRYVIEKEVNDTTGKMGDTKSAASAGLALVQEER
jgi:two-component system, NarL family, invasion response regulator UvrY